MKLQGIEKANQDNHNIRMWTLLFTVVALILGIVASLFYILGYNREIQSHVTNLEAKVNDRTKELNEVCTVLEEKTEQLENLVIHDTLTGIANRRRFSEVIDREWKTAVREKNTLAVIMIDVDYFKDYNDHYGHTAGDFALQKIARTLQEHLKRPADFVCRYGGEEFLVILPNSDSMGVKLIAQELRVAIENLNLVHEYSHICSYMTISLGMVIVSLPSLSCQSIVELIDLADKMLYKAKHNGRNQVQYSEIRD